jgi:hypothetical protein
MNVMRWPNQVRMRWAGYVACMGQRKCACWVLMGKPEGKSPRVIPRGRCADNIEMGVNKWERRASIALIWKKIRTSEGAVVNTVTKLYTLYNVENYLVS